MHGPPMGSAGKKQGGTQAVRESECMEVLPGGRFVLTNVSFEC